MDYILLHSNMFSNLDLYTYTISLNSEQEDNSQFFFFNFNTKGASLLQTATIINNNDLILSNDHLNLEDHSDLNLNKPVLTYGEENMLNLNRPCVGYGEKHMTNYYEYSLYMFERELERRLQLRPDLTKMELYKL